MKSIAQFVLIAALIGPSIYGCGSPASTAPTGGSNPTLNPTPTISTILPNSAAASGAAFTLTVNGMNFLASSVVNFGGAARTTTFVSSTRLTAAIPAAAIATAGTASATVTNPAPGGGTSNAVNFAITSGTNPVPVIDSLVPSGVVVGGPAFTLSVYGSNFGAGSVVQWNGSDRPTRVVVSYLITAQIAASDIAATGTAAITVFNPAPGGGSSDSLTFTIATGGVNPRSVAVDPTGKFAYVANTGSDNISMYSVDAATGVLTLRGTIAAVLSPNSVAVHPSGKFAYVTNVSDTFGEAGWVSMYSINVGALTSLGTPVFADVGPLSVAVDPFGRFAYVANAGNRDFAGNVSMYTINATTGVLTSIGTIAAGFSPNSVAVHPSGKFAYVANAGNVSMYSIDATTGALTSIGTEDAGLGSVLVAVDPTGKFAYVANAGNVSMYSIEATTGALTSIGTIAAGPGLRPTYIAIGPSGRFAYVTNSGGVLVGNVSIYTINATTGFLTSIGSIAAGLLPTSIAIDPSGKFAYVTNYDSHNISMYTIDPDTGALTLIGTIGT